MSVRASTRLALDLLGRDVVDRADDVAGLGELRARALDPLRQAEVGEERGAALDQHVGGLDVAVDQALAVRGVERGGDLAADVDRAVRAQPALGAQHRGEVGALDVLHREVEQPVLLARVVDGDDVRVLQGSGDPRLAIEALAEARGLGQLGRDDLDRRAPAQVEVLSPIDQAHAAAPDPFLDPVARDDTAQMRVRCRVRHHVSVWMTTSSPAPVSWLSAGTARMPSPFVHN